MQQQDSTFSNFLTSREASLMLGVSVTSVQEWVERGKLEGWKTSGGHRRITHASVLRVMQERFEANKVAEPPQSMSILIVEDDENLIRLYIVHMAQWPFNVSVFTTGNGYEALVMVGDLADIDAATAAQPNNPGAEPQASPEAEIIRRADVRRVEAAIAALPLPFRELVVLRDINDLSYKEIAQLLELPIGTVMSRLARGRQQLALLLGRPDP